MLDPPASTGKIGPGVETARRMKVTPVHCGPFVNESERKAFEQIKSRLISVPGDGEWLLLTNLAFSGTHRLQSDEIDVVAIGPPGVRVIEVKHWTAAWVDRNPGLVEQEADRVTNKARKIGTTLRRKVANLGRVDGAFLVTEEPVSKVKRLEGQLVRGVPFHTFRTWRDAVGVDAPGSLSSRQIETLARAPAPRSGVATDGALKRLAGHVRLKLQTPADERFHRIYRGSMPRGRIGCSCICTTCRRATSRMRRPGRVANSMPCFGCGCMRGRPASSSRSRTCPDTWVS